MTLSGLLCDERQLCLWSGRRCKANQSLFAFWKFLKEIEIFVSFFKDGRFVLGFVSSHGDTEVAAFGFFESFHWGKFLMTLPDGGRKFVQLTKFVSQELESGIFVVLSRFVRWLMLSYFSFA